MSGTYRLLIMLYVGMNKNILNLENYRNFPKIKEQKEKKVGTVY